MYSWNCYDLIETYWNVNMAVNVGIDLLQSRFNRDILECKCKTTGK